MKDEEKVFLVCRECNIISKYANPDIESFVCHYCVQVMVGPPEIKPLNNYKRTGRPRGWTFMKEFVDKDGTVYHKGVEQPELKGTKPPTPVKPKKTKWQRNQEKQKEIREHNKNKKRIRRKVSRNTQ